MCASQSTPTLGPLALSLKTLRFGGHVLLGFAVLLLIPLLRGRIVDIVGWWYRKLLRILGLHIHINGEAAKPPVLMAANHVTWVDIILLGGLTGAAFVSKAEIANWPMVGRYAKLTGTVFLPRGAFRTGEVSARLQQALSQGRSVLLFPEATTSAALVPERFHARLFGAAIDGGYPVQPVAVHYLPHDGPQDSHHPLAPWVNDANLLDHLVNLMRLRRLDVKVDFCPPIEVADKDRRSLAEVSRQAIVTALSGS